MPEQTPQRGQSPIGSIAADDKSAAQQAAKVEDLVVTGVRLANTDLLSGTVLGDWRVEHKIGEGGMGTVYAAVHRIIGKRAAIKVVRAELCASALTGDRFVQEARVVNQIGHPNIVDIFHIGTLDDGRPYLVMELLLGRTLAGRMMAGRMPAPEIVDILLQVCGALGAAHSRGVVHRDLKPDNIFLAEVQGRTGVKLLDWGIAKLLDTSTMAATLTTTGVIVGTPQYVSPEQARGKNIDHRTDIYSLGAIAYELFLEGPPFSAESVADLVAMHLREPPLPPSVVWPDIPMELERLLLAMLAKDPAIRPSLHDIATTLLRVRQELVGRAFAARRVGPGARVAMGSTPPPVSMASMGRHPTLPATPASMPAVTPTPRPTGSGEIPFAALRTPLPWIDHPARRARRHTMQHYTGGVRVRPRRWIYLSAAVSLAALAGVAWLLLRDTSSPAPTPVALPAPSAEQEPRVQASEESPAAHTAPAARPAPVAAPTPVAPAARPGLDIRVTPRNARITVDGSALTADDGHAVHAVATGTHVIEVDAAGYQPFHRSIQVADGTILLDVTLRKASASKRGRGDRKKPDSGLNPDGTIDVFE